MKLIGTSPSQVPTNADLGSLAYQDLNAVNITGGQAYLLNDTAQNFYNDTNISDTTPTLMLDFANSKTLDPRVTFSRASTGAYYDGTSTAVAEQNLVTYSEQFDNSGWTKTTTTVTANSLTAPDGNTTADTLTASGSNSTVLQTYTATAVAYTFSVWIYRKTGTGNIDITVDGTTWVTQSVTSGWTRFSTTLTPAAGSKTAGVRIATSGDEVYVWGAQLEQRSSVTAYTPTTSSAITNYIPVLKQAPAGVPRFDHNPVTGESLGLLIEEQRTNLLTYSDQFDNAAWPKAGTSVVSNVCVSPDGTISADKLIADTTNATHLLNRASYFAVTVGSIYTQTIYAKAGEYSYLRLQFQQTAFPETWANFNLQNGTVVLTAGSPTTSIVNVGNGWYRCSITATATSTTNSGVQPFVLSGNISGGSPSYTGDGYSGIYIWGAQLEAGSFATSYIPTVASQVTRSADSASMTGTNFSSWYNQGQGTFYSEALSFAPISSDQRAFTAYVTGGDQISIGSVVSRVRVNSVDIGSFFTSSSLAKNTISYGVGYQAASRNNVVITSANAGIPYGVSSLNIGANTTTTLLNGTIKKLAYYPIALSSAELQEMTV